MTVTVKLASHEAREWTGQQAASAEQLLQHSCTDEYHRGFERLMQSSFASLGAKGSPAVCPSSNGFVRAAVAAYSNHHHLVLRPEDVWFSILAQLNIYINNNAEEARHHFVAHEGKRELEVIDLGGCDFGELAERMSDMIAENVVDSELQDWIMPSFSTTVESDHVVASIMMMGALQKYFSYKFKLGCGLPSVTLLGTKADWEDILARLDKLASFGKQPEQWCQLLRPVLKRFVSTFKSPQSKETKDFWQSIANYPSGGSGPQYLSGWITAFCFWDGNGNSLYAPNGIPPQGLATTDQKPRLCLDDVLYHRIESTDIPPGYALVPVKVEDEKIIYDTHMIAGSVGISLSSSGGVMKSPRGKGAGAVGLDTMQPASGWWIFEVKGAAKP
jgi:hypothetical protein